MEHLKDYHELFNETDVLLLADVFESFRNICIKNYKLDPAHYYTAPGLSWDACLKMTDVKLELLTDVNMLLMVEKGIRGGVSMISNRYGKANNKYMGEPTFFRFMLNCIIYIINFITPLKVPMINTRYDPSKPSKYIQYLDANNLYGVAMSMKLPTCGFKWMNKYELNNWENYSCILKLILNILKSYMIYITIIH